MKRLVWLSLFWCSTSVAESRLEFRATEAVVPKPAVGGRLVVSIVPATETPRFTDVDAPFKPLFGIDVERLTADTVMTLDGATSFPAGKRLVDLPPGDYKLQAVFLWNRNLLLPNAPGNLHSAVLKYRHDPLAKEPTVVVLDAVYPEPKAPAKPGVKLHEIPSKLLSAFHGRPMVYRVGVVLPDGFDANGNTTYPLVVHIGGFGQRFTSAGRMKPDARFVQVLLDGAGPFGDPYQVNSANNGPYGDAFTTEVLPFLEATYRGSGKRFTAGGSTGGWSSLALQVFYPDVFDGCWSQCPDGVDFRAFQLADLTKDKNLYVNRFGFERPARRTLEGDTVYTVRHEAQLEKVLGRGGRWELGGQQWASWNAVYGPKGDDGLPKPLWNGATGNVDASVLKHWQKYDLRLQLETDWKRLGPKLAGKIHIWVGDADDYFLNNGVHRLKQSLAERTDPKFDGIIEIAPRRGHESGWSTARVLDEMAERLK